jgi:putative ABC transport system substrate-binding protein
MTMRRRFLVAAGASLLARPFLTRAAARDRPPRIGILNFGDPPASGSPPEPIVRYLAELNYVAGTSITYEYRYARGDRDRYVVLARELAAADPDVLFMPGSDIAPTLAAVTPAMPVVFAVSDDPVASGVVASLSRPGGRVTGVTHMSPELAAKRLQILKEAVPKLRRVAVLYEPGQVVQYYRQLELASRSAGIRLVPVPYRTVAELAPAFAAARRADAQAMFVEPNRFTLAYARQVAALAIDHRIPAISAYDAFVRGNGMLSYGATANEIVGRAAAQIDKILRGTPPGDIPVEQPVRFALVVNARAAEALQLKLPQALLLRADEVIQ